MCPEGHVCSQERARLAEGLWGDEDEGRIWRDLLMEELQIFAGIKAGNDLHPSLPYTLQI